MESVGAVERQLDWWIIGLVEAAQVHSHLSNNPKIHKFN